MRLFILFLVVILVGCNTDNALTEGQDNELQTRISILESEVSSQREVIERLSELNEQYEEELIDADSTISKLTKDNEEHSEGQIMLSEDQLTLVEFYKHYSPISYYSGIIGKGIAVSVSFEEPLRIAPTDNAPYLHSYEMSYIDGVDEIEVMVGDFLYYTYGEGKEPWCLVVIEGNIGYIKEKYVIEYIHRETDYNLAENFRDMPIGTTVDEIYFIFGETVDHGYLESRFDKSIYIELEQIDSDIQDYESGIWGIYNPQTRVLDYITVGTSEYILTSGFKVGDKADEVFEYYDEIYEIDEYGLGYDIGNGYTLEFEVVDGIIASITINSGYILSH